ncbi:MAG TPA: PH domain-containing protein, partial [Lamprocystis sp. (in: g-proteobacteria)]|nr:PH domain-containing protein [Lamprocystis sp. (in: g-proteobacteria)]
MRPIAALIVFLIMLAGVLLVGLGERFTAAVLTPRGFPLSGQDLQYLGVIIFGLGCLRLYAWYAPTRFERLTITDETLVWVRGFMSKQRIEVRRDAVRTLQVTQGLL